MKKLKISLFIVLKLFLLDKVNAQCDNSSQLEINAASSVVAMNHYALNEKNQNLITKNNFSKIILSIVDVFATIIFIEKYNQLKKFGGVKI